MSKNLLRYYNQTSLFTEGIKPCALFLPSEERSIEMRNMKYPYIHVLHKHANLLLFFQNTKEKHDFMAQHGLKQPIMFLNHRLIGNALGYPPLAYEAFPIHHSERYAIDYHGFSFVCRKKDVYECLHYMHTRYSIPERLQIGVEVLSLRKDKYGTELRYLS